jgi:acyl-CoA thioesterase-1
MANRMAVLLDRIFTVVPDTTIILSTLPPTAVPEQDAIVQQYNANLLGLVSARAAAGKRIFLVDCHSPVSVISLIYRFLQNEIDLKFSGGACQISSAMAFI